jgi:hypothetical protein
MPISEGSRQKRLKPTASGAINREESSPANTKRKPLPLGAGAHALWFRHIALMARSPVKPK